LNLSLDGLISLSDAAAEALAKPRPGVLRLDGLTSLSDAAAAAFAEQVSRLSLNGLTSLSEDAVATLSERILPIQSNAAIMAKLAEKLQAAEAPRGETTSPLKKFICRKCLCTNEVYSRGDEQVVFTGVYRDAEFVIPEASLPVPDENGCYIDIDVDDSLYAEDIWTSSWEHKIRNPTLRKRVDALIESGDPLDGLEALGFENSGGSYDLIQPLESEQLRILDVGGEPNESA
jgi:hypothetical protein